MSSWRKVEGPAGATPTDIAVWFAATARRLGRVFRSAGGTRRHARRNSDFALLYATGKPFSGNCGGSESANLTHNLPVVRSSSSRARLAQEGVMDLAMAMAVGLFGIFTASTYYFFHSLKR